MLTRMIKVINKYIKIIFQKISYLLIIFINFSGIKTTNDAHFYALSTKFPKQFSNEKKTLVIQFSVKHEQNIDCGGGYLKLFGCSPDDFESEKMHGETPYQIMFGMNEIRN